MADDDVDIDEGSGAGKKIATYSFTEALVTRQAQRVAFNTSAGAELAFDAGVAGPEVLRTVSASDDPIVDAIADLMLANEVSDTIFAGRLAPTTSAVSVAARANRQRLILINHHASLDAYVGPSGVTTSTGAMIEAGGGTLTLNTQAAVYVIGASGTGEVHYIEEY